MDTEFNTAVEKLYDCAVSPEKWPEALEHVAAMVGGVGTGLLFQRTDGALSFIQSPGALDAPTARYFAEGWNTRDIRAIRAIESRSFGMSPTYGDLDLVTPEEMDTHPFYTEFLAPHGLRWCLVASISPDPDTFVVLTVQRLASQGNFSERDHKVLEALSRHAEKALRLSCRLMRAELANLALREALQRVGCGVVVLDGNGSPVFSNAIGERYSEHVRLGEDGARRSIDTASLALEDQIRRVVASDVVGERRSERPVLIDCGPELGRVVAHVLPVTDGARSDIAAALGDVKAILMFVSQGESKAVDPAIVRDVLGVTLGEARVASLVGAGQSPREVAASLGITEETARTVLKRVFNKLNVSRQSQLAVLLGELSRMELRDPG